MVNSKTWLQSHLAVGTAIRGPRLFFYQTKQYEIVRYVFQEGVT
jgi:hypothetical protein